MVKVTVGEMSYEGTAEEIKELFEVLGAEFPSTPEAVEDSDEATKPSFKVGDIAVVTGETRCGDIGKGANVRVTRAELDGDGELCIYLLDGSDFDWAKPEALELDVDELAEARAKFPVGAKVRISIPEDEETRFKRDGVTNDEVGTVLEVSENFKGDKVIVSIDFDSRASYWNGIPSELEVVTEEDAKESEKWSKLGRKKDEFKKGDIVSVMEDNVMYSRNKAGDIGIISEVDTGTLPYRVDVAARREDSAGGWHSNESIKLVVPVEHRFDKDVE